MKKILFVAMAVSFGFLANAQPPEGEAKVGEWYGANISTDKAVPLNEVVAKLGENDKIENVKVKAKIVEVCPKKGCWISLELEDKTTAFVKMKDYAFFLPLAAEGKTVVLDAEITQKMTSVAELRHYAEDAKKSKEEIEAIKEPKKEVRLLASAIKIVE